MAQIRDYIRNQTEVQTLVPIDPNDGSYGFLQLEESVYKNGFSDLLLFADVGGVTALVLNTDYELSPADSDWTADEVGFSNKTVYPQFKITNATYQNVTVWATFTNFGVYTSADANFDMVGGSETVTTSATLIVPFGHTRYRFNFDSTSGDIAPTMPNGAFDGQQCILKDTGAANMTRIKGPGFYLGADSGGMYLKSRSILVTWNALDSLWEMDDAVVADWVSGVWGIKNTSSGFMTIDGLAGGGATVNAFGAVFYLPVAVTWPVAFINVGYKLESYIINTGGVSWGSDDDGTAVRTTTSTSVRIIGATAASASNIYVKISGLY